MSAAVGIDLGTTFSAVAYVNPHGIPEVIPNAEGDRITSSVILFENDDTVVGTYAKQAATVYPEQVVQFVKRHMGDPEFRFSYRGQTFDATQLSHFILAKLKHDAELRLGQPVTRAVITVPAYFNDAQRRSTMQAGHLAGLEVLGLLNEPTAAAIAYGLDAKHAGGRVLVFDLGGGTFDVTVCDIKETTIDVLATQGDHQLGGKDWDDVLIDHVSEAFAEKYGADPRSELVSAHNLRAQANQAKASLSARPKTNIFVDYAGNVLRVPITREAFESLSADLLQRCETLTMDVLKAAKVSPQEIDTVLLAGGSTRMPMIRDMLKRLFDKDPSIDINPDEAIALGAAVNAAALAATADGTDSPIDLVMHDVTSHTLGLAILSNGKLYNAPILPRNTRVPNSMTRDDIATSYDGQTAVDLWLVQGEDPDPLKCTVLGHFEFYGFPARPAGQTRLAVTYRYNANALVEVEAVDIATGQNLPFRMGANNVTLVDSAQGQSPTQVIAVVDNSGSMYGPPLDRTRTALRDLVGLVLQRPLHELAIVTVSDGIRQLPTANGQRLYRIVDELTAVGRSPVGETLEAAMQSIPPTPGTERLWVLFSDFQLAHPQSVQAALDRLRQQKASIAVLHPETLGGQASGINPAGLQMVSQVRLIEFPLGRSNLATQFSGG